MVECNEITSKVNIFKDNDDGEFESSHGDSEGKFASCYPV